jgi:flagellar basal body-associated protein FliL
MYSKKKQRGITLISLILLLGLIAFFTLLVLKIAPIYMDHNKVVHSLESLKRRPGIEKQSKQSVWIALNKQFNIAYVTNIKKNNVTITSRARYVKVRIAYHVKQPIIGNLSVWVDFDNSIEVGAL